LTIPYILHLLTQSLIDSGGLQTHGIFRRSTGIPLLQSTKLELEKGNYQVKLNDPNLCACLIKAWLKDIKEPVVPALLYPQCIELSQGTKEQLEALITKFPPENIAVMHHLVKLARHIAMHEEQNKMGCSNLAIVMSPSFCRCPDLGQILTNTKKETNFVCSLFMLLEVEDVPIPMPKYSSEEEIPTNLSRSDETPTTMSPRGRGSTENDHEEPVIPRANSSDNVRTDKKLWNVVGSTSSKSKQQILPDEKRFIGNRSKMLASKPISDEVQNNLSPRSILSNNEDSINLEAEPSKSPSLQGKQVVARYNYRPEDNNPDILAITTGQVFTVNAVQDSWYYVETAEGECGWIPVRLCAPFSFDPESDVNFNV